MTSFDSSRLPMIQPNGWMKGMMSSPQRVSGAIAILFQPLFCASLEWQMSELRCKIRALRAAQPQQRREEFLVNESNSNRAALPLPVLPFSSFVVVTQFAAWTDQLEMISSRNLANNLSLSRQRYWLPENHKKTWLLVMFRRWRHMNDYQELNMIAPCHDRLTRSDACQDG